MVSYMYKPIAIDVTQNDYTHAITTLQAGTGAELDIYLHTCVMSLNGEAFATKDIVIDVKCFTKVRCKKDTNDVAWVPGTFATA